ncbi:hypothetical protein CYLTODRAFT_324748, partial [Cylindrobasidium torrendii FP15055 ss-10]
PSLHRINNFLQLVVNDFLLLWDGVYFSRTHAFDIGLLVRAALAMVIADMLGLREILGHSNPTSMHFCTLCNLAIQNIHELDRSRWPPRIWDQMRRIAERWRDARSEDERAEIYAEHQLRWSPFYQLPYWNSLRCAPPEPMHFRALGIFQDLVRRVYGIN